MAANETKFFLLTGEGVFWRIAHALFPVLLIVVTVPASGASERVTFADLAGLSVEADIHRVQEIRSDGRSFSI